MYRIEYRISTQTILIMNYQLCSKLGTENVRVGYWDTRDKKKYIC